VQDARSENHGGQAPPIDVQTHRPPARDGYGLAATVFEPAGGHTRAAVLIAPAMGVEQRYYRSFATHLAERGLAAVTFDYRGIGGSRPPRLGDLEAGASDWGTQDLTAMIDWAADRYAPAPALLVGHSVGGQLLGLADNIGRLTALMTVASQAGHWRLFEAPFRYWVWLSMHALVPAVCSVLPYLPGRLLGQGADIPRGVALEWARWCRNRHYLSDVQGRPVRVQCDAYAGPIRAYSFADDHYAPRRTVEAFLGWFGAADKDWRHLAPGDAGMAAIGHFGFFRAGAGSHLWREAAAWLESHAT